MQTLITVVHVLTCVFLVAAVLIQSGKGAEISASFGGSSQTVFGTSGGANFLVKFTQGAAFVFFMTSILLTILGGQSKKSLFEAPSAVPVESSGASAPGQSTAPVQPGAPAAQGASDQGASAQTAPASGTSAPSAPAAPGASAAQGAGAQAPSGQSGGSK